jgi:chemotaxis signal transduction protein
VKRARCPQPYPFHVQALRFHMADQILAVHLSWVREVCPIVHAMPVPHAPTWMRGLMDYHGQVIPMVDGGVLLGAAPIRDRLGTRVLLLQGRANADDPLIAFGMVVDRVDGIMELRGSAWTPRQGLPGMPFVSEIRGESEGSILLLDPLGLAGMHRGLLEGTATLPEARSLPGVPS